jgi:Na+/proline symporter
MGGIATVVWTDALLFLLFIVGVGFTLLSLDQGIDGGLGTAFGEASAEGKFRFWNFDTDPTQAYTFWVAIIAITFSGIGSYGTDHMLAQRLLCCRSAKDARRAIIVSIVGMAITFAVALIGIGLWAYYQEHGLSGEAARLVAEKGDRIYPIFIADVLPAGVKGLVLAGALAAAVSSLDSILAALSQTTFSSLVKPLRARWVERERLDPRPAEEDAFALRASRWLVVGWALVLVVSGLLIEAAASSYDSILDLALAMATYTAGAILAAFFLALRGQRDVAQGLIYSAPLSVLLVFAIAWHGEGAETFCTAALACLLVAWTVFRIRSALGSPNLGQELARTLGLIALGGLIAWICVDGFWQDEAGDVQVLAWPWYVPCGAAMAYGGALVLARSRPT